MEPVAYPKEFSKNHFLSVSKPKEIKFIWWHLIYSHLFKEA